MILEHFYLSKKYTRTLIWKPIFLWIDTHFSHINELWSCTSRYKINMFFTMLIFSMSCQKRTISIIENGWRRPHPHRDWRGASTPLINNSITHFEENVLKRSGHKLDSPSGLCYIGSILSWHKLALDNSYNIPKIGERRSFDSNWWAQQDKTHFWRECCKEKWAINDPAQLWSDKRAKLQLCMTWTHHFYFPNDAVPSVGMVRI